MRRKKIKLGKELFVEPDPSDISRFFRFVKKNKNCWEWTGCRDGNGYGQFSYKGVTIGAHRFSVALFKGRIEEGMDVDHHNEDCIGAPCVNPFRCLCQKTRRQNSKEARQKQLREPAPF